MKNIVNETIKDEIDTICRNVTINNKKTINTSHNFKYLNKIKNNHSNKKVYKNILV